MRNITHIGNVGFEKFFNEEFVPFIQSKVGLRTCPITAANLSTINGMETQNNCLKELERHFHKKDGKYYFRQGIGVSLKYAVITILPASFFIIVFPLISILAIIIIICIFCTLHERASNSSYLVSRDDEPFLGFASDHMEFGLSDIKGFLIRKLLTGGRYGTGIIIIVKEALNKQRIRH